MYYIALILSLVVICLYRAPLRAAPAPVSVAMKNAKGETIGTAEISPIAKGVRIVVDVKGVPPGPHAIHFHERGSCVGPKFESAGGHFSPDKSAHGFDHKDGAHAGDMPNIFVPESGAVRVEIVNTKVTLAKSSLKKAGGTSLVLHANADDHKSQPSGNAGDRLACGEIK